MGIKDCRSGRPRTTTLTDAMIAKIQKVIVTEDGRLPVEQITKSESISFISLGQFALFSF